MLVEFKNCQFKSSTDIQQILQNRAVSAKVELIGRNYYQINFSQAMEDLSLVGTLLQLVYATSKEFQTAGKVLEILLNYQPLVNDSALAAGTFLQSSLQALTFHANAIRLAQKPSAPGVNNLQLAMKMIGQCQKMAHVMAEQTNTLVEQARALVEKSTNAAVSAQNERHLTVEEKQKMKQRLDDLEAKKAALKSRTQDLAEEIASEKKKEESAAEEAKKEQRKAFWLSLASTAISTAMKPLAEPMCAVADILKGFAGKDKAVKIFEGIQENRKQKQEYIKQQELELVSKKLELKRLNPESVEGQKVEEEIALIQEILRQHQEEIHTLDNSLREIAQTFNKQAVTFLEQEIRHAALRADLEKERREANADLAASVSRLVNATDDMGDLDKAIEALDMTIKTLGRVVDVFENARLFWSGVEKHCKSLTDISALEIWVEANLEDEFAGAITESAFQWLALANINLFAVNAIEGPRNTISGIIKNLPTREEVPALIHSLKPLVAQLAPPPNNNNNNNA